VQLRPHERKGLIPLQLYHAWVLWNGDMRVIGPLLFRYVFPVGT
jgi:hypothetical protein